MAFFYVRARSALAGAHAYTGPTSTRLGQRMETLLWAIDLLAVVWLCFWALREDGGLQPTGPVDGR